MSVETRWLSGMCEKWTTELKKRRRHFLHLTEWLVGSLSLRRWAHFELGGGNLEWRKLMLMFGKKCETNAIIVEFSRSWRIKTNVKYAICTGRSSWMRGKPAKNTLVLQRISKRQGKKSFFFHLELFVRETYSIFILLFYVKKLRKIPVNFFYFVRVEWNFCRSATLRSWQWWKCMVFWSWQIM